MGAHPTSWRHDQRHSRFGVIIERGAVYFNQPGSFERNRHPTIQTFDRPRYSIEQSVGLKIQRLLPLRILTTYGGGDALYHVWIVPLWLPILFLAVLPLMAKVRRKKVPPGCCRRCGYDLRVTASTCPECSQPVAPNLAAPLPPLPPPTKL